MMLSTLGVLLLAAETLTGGPRAYITDPVWTKTPTREEIVAVLPQAARAAGRDGVVTLECGVARDGRLENCFAAREDPAELGYGEAALSLAAKFKMKSKDAAGQKTAGRYVRIPLAMRAD